MNGATNTGYPALLLMIEEWILQRSIKKLVLQIRFMKKQQRGYDYKDSDGNSWDEKFVS